MNIPELPPGIVVTEKDANSVRLGHADYPDGDYLCSVMLVTNYEDGPKLFMGRPEDERWVLQEKHNSVDDAVGAGVARLWLGIYS